MRLTDLPVIVTASMNDVMYVVDVSDTSDFLSGSSKQITIGNFLSSSGTLLNTGSVYPITSSWSENSISSSYAITASYALNAGLTSSIIYTDGIIDAQTIISDGTTSSYSLIQSVGSEYGILVSINGVVQNYSCSYTISSSTINFVENVPSSSIVDIRYLAGGLGTSSYSLNINGIGGRIAKFSNSNFITSSILIETGSNLVVSGSIISDGYCLSSNSFNSQTQSIYVLTSTDNGKIVTFNNTGSILLNVPSNLGENFSCKLIQLGTGQVTINGSGSTVNGLGGANKLIGQYAQASLISYNTNLLILSGDITT